MVKIKNIKFVAWLRLKGIHPDEVEKISRGRAKYGFKLEEEKLKELQKEFDRSEFLTYAQCMDAVIDLAY